MAVSSRLVLTTGRQYYLCGSTKIWESIRNTNDSHGTFSSKQHTLDLKPLCRTAAV